MIPSSLLGLVVFAASIGPGYVWVRVAETRVPRGPRTQLLEVAELIIIGGLSSTLAFLLVFSVASATDWIDNDALAAGGFDYVTRHPTRALSALVIGLVLAYVGSYVVARWVVYRHNPPILSHGHSAWHSWLLTTGDRVAYATVDLRDETTIAGWVLQVTTDEVPPAERDLVLAAGAGEPLKVRPREAERFFDSSDALIIVNGADVFSLSVSYHSFAERSFKQALVDLGVVGAAAEEGESP